MFERIVLGVPCTYLTARYAVGSLDIGSIIVSACVFIVVDITFCHVFREEED